MNRYIYEKNPIYEVVLRIDFPHVLCVNTEEPTELQEKIRVKYPFYNSFDNSIAGSSINDIDIFSQTQSSVKTKRHIFVSKNKKNKFVFSSNFITFSTKQYIDWETFSSDLNEVLAHFNAIYKPAFYQRVSLKYVDVISRENIGLQGCKWKDLILPEWIGIFSNKDEKQVLSMRMQTEYLLSDNLSVAKIQTGLGQIEKTKEVVFVIESNFLKNTDELPIENFVDTVNYLHNNAGMFIQGVFSERLQKALKPRKAGQYCE